jgi:NAD(P)-dependent dehydrogenase (short-subunit alcohol dehydrogenase family)
LFGTIDEVTEDEVRAQMETNFFGALWVTKAALPILREQRSGHILQVSSIGGVNAWPITGIYHASKWALEAFSQSLAAEMAEWNIHVTLIEPTGYATDWSGPSAVRAEQNPIYDGVRTARDEAFAKRVSRRGDPEATGPAVLTVVDAEEPPLRVFLGEGCLDMIRAEYESRIENWERWEDVAVAAHGTVAR